MPPRKGKTAAPAPPQQTPAQIAAAAALAAEQAQILPQKDQTLFKQVVKFYETKQYKKALKSADSILRKNANHGETLAMKGLIYNQLKKSDEAQALVKKGLAANIKSHVCWHVYGLIHRSEHRYDEAIKCYQNALKRDKENLQILKDLSALQIHRRMHAGFTETRRRILLLKTTNSNNWLAYAIGCQLCGLYDKAIEVVDTYMKTQSTEENKEKEREKQFKLQYDEKEEKLKSYNNNTTTDKEEFKQYILTNISQFMSRDKIKCTYEDSELHIYRYTLLLLTTNHNKNPYDTYTYLHSIQHKLMDSLYYLEQNTELLLLLNRNYEAEIYARYLISLNSDNTNYHTLLQKSLNLDTTKREDEDKLIELYSQLQTTYPQSSLIKRLPLEFSENDKFIPLLINYMKRFLRKGIPSLFVDLLPLYTDNNKITTIENTMENMLIELRAHNRFSTTDPEESESPACLLWALYFAAQHYDHLNQHQKSLTYVNEALNHTPTTLDLYLLQARIYKHAGDNVTAFHSMNTARLLDTADRYLNTKCVRYALRMDDQTTAEELISLFLRDDADGLHALTELQAMWYENHLSSLYCRTEQYSRALKYYRYVIKHYDDIYEDQFDFHTYCLRKCTLRSYIAMLSWEDKLKGHKWYVRAAVGLIKLYVKLWDMEREKVEKEKEEREDENLTAEEKKALIKKQKKAAGKEKKKALEEKKEKEDLKAKSATPSIVKPSPKSTLPPDPDPDGLTLLALPSLPEASKYVQHLIFHAAKRREGWELGAGVYLRREKWLLAWKCIKKLKNVEGDSPDWHVHAMTFIHQVGPVWASLNSTVQSVLNEELTEAGFVDTANSKPDHPATLIDVKSANEEYLQHHLDSLPHRLAVARIRILIEPKSPSALSLLAFPLNPSSPSQQIQPFSIPFASDVLDFINRYEKSSTRSVLTPINKPDGESNGPTKSEGGQVSQSFTAECHSRFPLCLRFGATPVPVTEVTAGIAKNGASEEKEK